MTNSNTPRTDAKVVILPKKTESYITQNSDWVAASFARQLERECKRLKENNKLAWESIEKRDAEIYRLSLRLALAMDQMKLR